jgi:hypothetical protein
VTVLQDRFENVLQLGIGHGPATFTIFNEQILPCIEMRQCERRPPSLRDAREIPQPAKRRWETVVGVSIKGKRSIRRHLWPTV